MESVNQRPQGESAESRSAVRKVETADSVADMDTNPRPSDSTTGTGTQPQPRSCELNLAVDSNGTVTIPPEIRNQLPVDLDEQTVYLDVTIHGVDAVADLQPESDSL